MRVLITLVALFFVGCSTPQAVYCPPLDKELFGKSRVEVSVFRPLMDTSPTRTEGDKKFHKEILTSRSLFRHVTYIFGDGRLEAMVAQPKGKEEFQTFLGKMKSAYGYADETFVASTQKKAMYWELPDGEVFMYMQGGSISLWSSIEYFYGAT